MTKFFKTLFIVFLMTSMYGCTIEEDTQKLMNENKYVNLIPVNEKAKGLHLVYDDKTFIVYYFEGYTTDKRSVNYMCPYYSENGHICRYNTETNKIEEVK